MRVAIKCQGLGGEARFDFELPCLVYRTEVSAEAKGGKMQETFGWRRHVRYTYST